MILVKKFSDQNQVFIELEDKFIILHFHVLQISYKLNELYFPITVWTCCHKLQDHYRIPPLSIFFEFKRLLVLSDLK